MSSLRMCHFFCWMKPFNLMISWGMGQMFGMTLSPIFSQNSLVSSKMSTFQRLSSISCHIHPSFLTPSASLQHVHLSTLAFPPLTIIIEVHLSKDLIRPLLWRGFILWHLHHRWHHLVDGLTDGARDWKKEQTGFGGGWGGWGGERKESEFKTAGTH